MKRTPAGEALDTSMLTNGLGNLDSRGLAALLKELAKERHAKRAREVSRQRAGGLGVARQQLHSCPANRSSQLLLLQTALALESSSWMDHQQGDSNSGGGTGQRSSWLKRLNPAA